MYRASQPLCVQCKKEGRLTIWTQLDHIIALENGGPDTEDNVQGLCDDCHRAKTAVDMVYKEKPTIGADGWPT
jgi:5-methylcytosine-specific restriction protein A